MVVHLRSCEAWLDTRVITMDLTDPNLWHFFNELMLPTFHSLLHLDLMPSHIARCADVSI